MPARFDLARATHALPPLAQLREPPQALARLSELIGAARIVALGESFHHTHEQLALRGLLMRHLISQLGFNVIVLEVITPGPNPIDAYVRGGDGDAAGALIQAGARMWRNQETAALMHWVRTWNCSYGGKAVSVRGLDVLAIGPLMRAVAHTARMADAERIIALSQGFNIDGRSDQVAYNQLSSQERLLLRRTFVEASKTLGATADNALETAREQTQVVLQALDMLDVGLRGWTEGFALRDAAMADAVSRLVARSDPRDRFILLAHNTHIATCAPAREPAPMGEHLKARFGDAYFALGGSFRRTRFAPPIYGVAAFDEIAGTIDHEIAVLGHAAALVDLRGRAHDQPLRMQSAGLGPARTTEYPRRAFDALAFVDTLTNAQQLIETELGLDAASIDATRR